jgi:hypothetical protein
MTDVSSRLRDLGLGQYEAAFRENAISPDLLPNLTAEDLKGVGVAALGRARATGRTTRACLTLATRKTYR